MSKQAEILRSSICEYLLEHPNSSSTNLHAALSKAIGLATLKRALLQLVKDNTVAVTGQGKNTRYALTPCYALLREISPDSYFQIELDKRHIIAAYNFNLLSTDLLTCQLFTPEELTYLDRLQATFTQNVSGLSSYAYNKEFERLAIDLSWKSSQIEGNTYSLLETERLIKEQLTASGKTRDEATMLINHKLAIDFILAQPNYLTPLQVNKIEDIHSMLVKELGVDRNVRHRRVGISGTNYTPLDNEFQIKEQLTQLCVVINGRKNVFEKAFLALVLISYIQPFLDGNKRTARIISNALLIYHQYCPLSFRTVEAIDYKKAMLIFYEQNNISAMKKIFISQYEFAVNTYF